MSTTDEHLQRIRVKLQQLLKQQASLLKENQHLREEVRSLQHERTRTATELDELRQKTEVWKYSQNDLDETEKKLMEKKLALYIREIDRCIAMLGR